MDNFILRDENAVYFECGYSCDNEIFISFEGQNYFLTDARYTIEARQNIKNAQVIETQRDIISDAKMLIKKLDIKELIFDPYDFSVAVYSELTSFSDTKFHPSTHFSKKKRMVKSADEIALMKEAAKIGADCFDEFANFLNDFGEGATEEELQFEAVKIFQQHGRLGLSFNPIFAINENAAKAHALPSQKRLKRGDLVLLDAGVKYKRFCSDRTRTAFFGDKFEFTKFQQFENSKQNEVYEIVKNAQELAIKAVKPGIKACEVDAVARDYIIKAGFGKEFFHSTGHGVGLDIHELPNINAKSEVILEEGMIFSVEPGIYIENEFGVRVEDVVVVTKDGCEIL